jgi:hypothetical protein
MVGCCAQNYVNISASKIVLYIVNSSQKFEVPVQVYSGRSVVSSTLNPLKHVD